MHPSTTAEENPDIDYREMYRGRKCAIAFGCDVFHDFSDLEEFPDLMRFLDMYRDCGLNEKLWTSEKVNTFAKPITISALSNQCNVCPHSKLGRDKAKAEARARGDAVPTATYRLPNKKCVYDSCPLEKNFSAGVEVNLEYQLRKNVVCNHCHMKMESPDFTSLAKLPFFDVRLNGTPAKLLISRKEETCRYCHGRIAVSKERPNIAVDSKHQMTIRLIYAIKSYSTRNGISTFCKKHIAQGYGISYSLLKKFYRETSDDLRKRAEQTYLEYVRYKEEHPRNKFIYSVVTPRNSMSFCFSELSFKKAEPELFLCAAFDKNEIDTVSDWARGEFSPALPSGMTDTHLDFLAAHCADIVFPGVNHRLAFRMVQLAITYGKFLKSGRYATEAREITETLIRCLRALSSGDMSFYEFERHIDLIEGWSSDARKQRIFRAARRVRVILGSYLGYRHSAPLREVVYSPIRQPTEESLCHAARIAHLTEKSLLSSAQQQVESDEDPDGFYGTNSALAILRLLYINPAANYDSSLRTYMGIPFCGVPASVVETMLKNGLLDDQGRDLTKCLEDTSTQNPNRIK